MLDPRLVTPFTVTVLALVIGLFAKVERLLTTKSCGLFISNSKPPPSKSNVSIVNKLEGELVSDSVPPFTVNVCE